MAHLHDNGKLTPAGLALGLLPSATWSRVLGSLLSLPAFSFLSGLWWWSWQYCWQYSSFHGTSVTCLNDITRDGIVAGKRQEAKGPWFVKNNRDAVFVATDPEVALMYVGPECVDHCQLAVIKGLKHL